MISVDDLRPLIRNYANPQMKTPNFDKLINTGFTFNRAYSQIALCAPSRASILSGQRPDTIEMHDLYTDLRSGPFGDTVTFPEYFKSQGYYTEAIGKILHGNQNDDISWNNYIETTQAQHGYYAYADPNNIEINNSKTIFLFCYSKIPSN